MGYSYLCCVKITCFVLLVLADSILSQNTTCSFEYLYHFGDGVTDIGNSIRVLPWGPFLPAAHLPYGKTFPGWPTGRWSNGLIDFDFAARDFGFPNITPYLSSNSSSSKGVIFSVARSPVLDHKFFKSRGVKIPPYAVPLHVQLSWFKTHLRSNCKTRKGCAKRLGKSLILMGDIEGNDIGYALAQGKSIKEVETYVPYVVRALIKTTREVIKMGARVVIIPGNAPIGCYPYILAALTSNDSAAYDNLGCLKSVNDLIKLKNNYLQRAVKSLSKKFPNVTLSYGPFDEGVRAVLTEASAFNDSHENVALKACCGIGGRYNYDKNRFCGKPGVPVCSNPDQYIFWDGLHFTQQAYARVEHILFAPTISKLTCPT